MASSFAGQCYCTAENWFWTEHCTSHSALKYGLTGRFALPKGGVAFRGQQALKMLQECQVDAAENSDEGKWVMANGTCGEAYCRFGF
ncbi:MAG: hypothetical protein LASZOEIN_002205 [Candidatus Fervidibacter sp.]